MTIFASPGPTAADVVIVGGGMAGLATAYHLAQEGSSVILLQAGDIGGGTSAACTGRAQVNEGHLDPLNMRLIRDGLARLATLEEKLGMSFEWRQLGYLCLIPTEALWHEWTIRAGTLSAGGIPTEMLDRVAVAQAEPCLNTAGYLGAAYSVEGFVNPMLFCWAYAQAARRLGANLYPHTPVTAIDVDNDRVTGVITGDQRFTADRFALMTGAWTPTLLELAGAELPVCHTHAEAFVTAPLPPILNNTIGLADFYETIHGRSRAVSVGLSPEPNGSLLVTEAVTQTGERHRRCSIWGLAGMAADLMTLIPALRPAHVVRGWGIPTPFTPDDEPVIGWVPGRSNLFVAAGFLLSITAMPVLGEWMARMILDRDIPDSMEIYSPARFAGHV